MLEGFRFQGNPLGGGAKEYAFLIESGIGQPGVSLVRAGMEKIGQAA